MNAGRRVADLPEINVAIFAFLLNYPWEFLQVPFFEGMPGVAHWDAVKMCTRAAAGDAVIAVVAFWGAAYAGSRRWILEPAVRHVALFVAAGLAITVALEWLSTRVLDRWSYADAMPIVPVLGVGLLPLLQWTVLPLLIVWFVRRQLS